MMRNRRTGAAWLVSFDYRDAVTGMSRRAICATSAGHTLHAVSNRTWYQPGRINRAYQRTNLTELSGSHYGAGILTTKFQGKP